MSETRMIRTVLLSDQKAFCDAWEDNLQKKFCNMSFREFEDSWLRNRMIKFLEINGFSIMEATNMNDEERCAHYYKLKK